MRCAIGTQFVMRGTWANSPTASHQRVPQNLHQVPRLSPGPVFNLLSAGHAGNRHFPIVALSVDRREQRLFPDGHGNVVMLLLKSEGPRHTAATGVYQFHFHPRG